MRQLGDGNRFLINILIISILLQSSSGFAITNAPDERPIISCSQSLASKWTNQAKDWFNYRAEKLGRRESFYPTKKAYNILYPRSGDSPLDQNLADYFPGVYDEVDQELQEIIRPRANNQNKNIQQLDIYRRNTHDYRESFFYSDAEFKPFRDQALHLLFLRRGRHGDGRTGEDQFKQWAIGAIEGYRDKTAMKRLLLQPHTWRTFFDVELKQRFDESGYLGMSKLEKALYKKFENPAAIIVSVATYRFLRWAVLLLGSVTVVGVIPNYLNHATAPPQSILFQKVDQWSIKHEAWLTNWMQYKMVDASGIKAQSQNAAMLQKEMNKLNIQNLKGETPDKAENELSKELNPLKNSAQQAGQIMVEENKRFEDMLKTGIDMNTMESGYLPGNQANARGIVWGSQIFFPLDMASRVVGFDTNYTAHETLLEILNQEIESAKHASHPDAVKISALEDRAQAEKRAMEVASEQAATALAVWKVNEFFFPELTRKWLSDDDLASLTKTYRFMKDKFLYDYYLQAYEKQADTTVGELREIYRLRQEYLKKH